MVLAFNSKPFPLLHSPTLPPAPSLSPFIFRVWVRAVTLSGGCRLTLIFLAGDVLQGAILLCGSERKREVEMCVRRAVTRGLHTAGPRISRERRGGVPYSAQLG